MQHVLFVLGQKTGKALKSEVDLLYYFTDSKTKGKQTKRNVDRRIGFVYLDAGSGLSIDFFS